MRRIFPAIMAVLILALAGMAKAQTYDLVIRGGKILDGSGNPEYIADIAIKGDMIAAIGQLDNINAKKVIDATGLYITPGFIDMHSHADRNLTSDNVDQRKAPNLVAQGITTVVFAPDGRNPVFPMRDEIAAYRKLGVGLNVIPMVGHGTLRGKVMGRDYERAASDDEIKAMQQLVRDGMEAGAWGMGAGPEYRPGRFSTTAEIIALAQVVADYDGFYYSHQRSQSQLPKWQMPSMVTDWRLDGIDGMRETIEIGRHSGIRVVGSHIKAKGRASWGHSAIDVIMIDRARAEGVQVYLDQYPYETFGGAPTLIMPQWGFAPAGTDRSGGLDDPLWNDDALFKNYKENFRSHLDDPTRRAELIADIEFLVDLNGGPDGLIIVVAPIDGSLVGKTLEQVAQETGKTYIDVLIDFTLRGTEEMMAGVAFRPMAAHPFDVETYMRQEYTATSTDAGVQLRKRAGQHPRYFGAFPRKIAKYVREDGVITLPFAIRSMTGLGAQIIGLKDRGLLREGYKADITVFDYDRIQDHATVLAPQDPPEGIELVLINGQIALENGQPTGALAGEVLIKKKR